MHSSSVTRRPDPSNSFVPSRSQADVPFPKPAARVGRTKRWRWSHLAAYEAALAGEPAPTIDPADEVYLTSAQVKARYSVNDMWLWRHTVACDRKPATAETEGA